MAQFKTASPDDQLRMLLESMGIRVNSIHSKRKDQAMKTPTEAQLKDPKWWDENAPEGATHYHPAPPGLFYKHDHYWSFHDRRWVMSLSISARETTLQDLVPRPTTSPTPEWDGEGLPPVGCECEAYVSLTGHSEGWCEVEVLKVCEEKRSAAVMLPMMSLQWATEFRPIRTKEQRERDDLAKLIDDFRVEQGSFWTPEKEAGAIIAAGWLKNKAERHTDDSPRAKGFLCGEAYRRLPDEEKASMEWQAHAERIISHLYDAGMLRKAGGA